MVYDVADLERRLAAGEWLPTGAVAVLLGQGRTTIHEWVEKDRIRYRRTLGGQRRCHPDDVRRLIAESQQIHGGPDDSGPALEEQGQEDEQVGE